jgi:thiosulfate/3-mercaptopyruvate sulfurtransferase
MKCVTIISMVMALLVGGLLIGGKACSAEGTPPVITTKWLLENKGNPRLVIVDIRKVAEYRDGHIPGSVNLTYNAWRTTEKGISCQLPLKEDIEEDLSSVGIGQESIVVIVGKTETDLDRAHPARVAWTMKYAGISKGAILDGGYERWTGEGRPVEKGWAKARPRPFCCKWNERVLCSKDCLKEKAGRVTIVDTRIHSYFTGEVKDPGASKQGHIPGSVNLPYTLAFNEDGTYVSREKLASHAVRAVGKDTKKEIVLLCCTGRFSPTWWFMLSEVLGYENVSIFDGSLEEWCRDASAPLVRGE